MSPRDLYVPVRVAGSALVGENCILGYPKEARLRAWQDDPSQAGAGKAVTVGEGCLLFNQIVLFEGVELAADCVVEDRVRIGYDTTVVPGRG